VIERPQPPVIDPNGATVVAPIDPVLLGRQQASQPGETRATTRLPRPSFDDGSATIVGSLVDHLEPSPVCDATTPPRRTPGRLGAALGRLRALPPMRKGMLLLAVLSACAAAAAAPRIGRPPAQRRLPSQVESSNVMPAPSPILADARAAPMARGGSPGPLARSGSAVTGTDTLEREAVDALARGTFGQAAALYDRLGQAHPEDPRFRVAARLARRRIAPAEER
jgi:hypothetical protein